MKTKKLSSKLLLNKETLVNLEDVSKTGLDAIRGGWPKTSVGVVHNCYTLCITYACCPVQTDVGDDD